MQGNIGWQTKTALKDPSVPERYRNPAEWPEPARDAWADDEGEAAAERHREAVVEELRKARVALDEFHPDLVVVWGDDQYENFKEDVIPAFSVLAYEEFQAHPWQHRSGPNVWNEPADRVLSIKGHRDAGKYLTTRLLEEGFDVAYAYKPLHRDLGHAFLNSVLLLDWDRTGWSYPLLAFAVNCYGRKVVAQRATSVPLSLLPDEEELDPPSPPPWRCFDLGAATARIFAASPWRVALLASSSWSHAFLTPKTYLMFPDVESDRQYFEAMKVGDYALWRQTTTEEIEERGQQEMLNWFCLVGAMAELDRRPHYCAFVESWLCNSDKVFAAFPAC